MTLENKIKYLEAAEKAFRQEPDSVLNNAHGLCRFFEAELDLSEMDIKDILGKKYADYYTFYGRPQYKIWYVWSLFGRFFRYSRANWCKRQIKKLKREKANN